MDTTTNTPKAKKSDPKKSKKASPAEVEKSAAAPVETAAPESTEAETPKTETPKTEAEAEAEAEEATAAPTEKTEATPETKVEAAAPAADAPKAEKVEERPARVKRYNSRVSSYEEAWERAEAMGYSREDLVTRSGAIKIAGIKSSGAFNTAMWYAHKGDPVTDEGGNWVYDGKQEVRKQREGFHPKPVVGTIYGSYSLWLKGDMVRFREATKRPTQRAAVRAAAVRATGRTRKAAKRPTAKAAARNQAKRASTLKVKAKTRSQERKAARVKAQSSAKSAGKRVARKGK
jgi:hypothetical protein